MSYQAPSLSEYVNLGRSMREGAENRSRREEEIAQRKRDNELRDAQEARNQEIHDVRMGELRAQKEGRIALADAAAPAQVDAGYQVTDTAGSNAFTKDPDAAAAMQDMAQTQGNAPTLASATRVNKQVYTDPTKASKAEADYNSTDATLGRQVKALQTSDPAKAITLANAGIDMKKKQSAQADTDTERGIYDTQDPQGLADLMSRTLTEKMGVDVQAEHVPSPDGKSWVLGINVGGQRHAIGQFSNDDAGLQKAKETVFNRMASPEAQRGLKKFNTELESKRASGEAALTNAKANQTRAGALQTRALSGGAAGNPSREDRIRYTSLFNDAGRRLGEANRTLTTLQKNTLFMAQARNPDSDQARQLQDLRDSISKYEEERTQYQGLLAGSQAPKGKEAAPATPKPAAGQPAQPTSQAEYDALPKGARYMRDGLPFIKN